MSSLCEEAPGQLVTCGDTSKTVLISQVPPLAPFLILADVVISPVHQFFLLLSVEWHCLILLCNCVCPCKLVLEKCDWFKSQEMIHRMSVVLPWQPRSQKHRDGAVFFLGPELRASRTPQLTGGGYMPWRKVSLYYFKPLKPWDYLLP